MPISWIVGEHPDEKLANDMLLQALVRLKTNEHPSFTLTEAVTIVGQNGLN